MLGASPAGCPALYGRSVSHPSAYACGSGARGGSPPSDILVALPAGRFALPSRPGEKTKVSVGGPGERAGP